MGLYIGSNGIHFVKVPPKASEGQFFPLYKDKATNLLTTIAKSTITSMETEETTYKGRDLPGEWEFTEKKTYELETEEGTPLVVNIEVNAIKRDPSWCVIL